MQRAVVGQEDQSFTVGVEPTRRVDIWDGNEVLERGAPARGAELANDAVGFVECDQHEMEAQKQKTPALLRGFFGSTEALRRC